MLFFYRVLGLVVWFGLGLTGMVLFTLVTWLGEWQGVTLTLSGVTGIIVSVGVTVDSYVVYFERLKDEVRTGKTVRSSIEVGWKRAWRTIVAADSVALIGAGVLYILTIGSVKGFAYFLALSTIVDLVLAWCYMHPLVSLMARRSSLVARAWHRHRRRPRRRREDSGMTATIETPTAASRPAGHAGRRSPSPPVRLPSTSGRTSTS